MTELEVSLDEDNNSTCAICKETLFEPVTFICQHNVCKLCFDEFLLQYMNDKKKDGPWPNKKLECPVCRTPIINPLNYNKQFHDLIYKNDKELLQRRQTIISDQKEQQKMKHEYLEILRTQHERDYLKNRTDDDDNDYEIINEIYPRPPMRFPRRLPPRRDPYMNQHRMTKQFFMSLIIIFNITMFCMEIFLLAKNTGDEFFIMYILIPIFHSILIILYILYSMALLKSARSYSDKKDDCIQIDLTDRYVEC